jgi:hypothetical protein
LSAVMERALPHAGNDTRSLTILVRDA